MFDPTSTFSCTTTFLGGLGQFTGIFLGVVAGTAVTILVQKWDQLRNEKKQIANLKFELTLNIKKVESWLEELEKYRNALNGDSIHDYFGYFNLSSAVVVVAFQLHQSGLIYRHLSHEHIGQLQEVFNDLSINGENFLNNQIFQRKQEFNTLRDQGSLPLWQQNMKPQIVRDIDFWEQKFKSHLNSLRSIVEALPNAG